MDNRRSQPVRIMLADDHPIFRDGLRRLLEAEPDLKVIGEACDGAEAVKMARQLKPDILLLDLAMPRMPGLEALREMSSGPVVQLGARHSAHRCRGKEADCRSPAAWSSRRSAEGFRHPITAEKYSHGHVGRILGGTRKRLQPGAIFEESGAVLRGGGKAEEVRFDPRELEIVSAVVAGYSNKEIAEYFKISEDTVKHHFSNIFDKLGVSTRLELALFAVNQALPIKTIA